MDLISSWFFDYLCLTLDFDDSLHSTVSFLAGESLWSLFQIVGVANFRLFYYSRDLPMKLFLAVASVIILGKGVITLLGAKPTLN